MAFDFAGANNRLNPGSPAHLDNLFAGGATIMAWTRQHVLGANFHARIAGKTNLTSDGGGWYFYTNVNGGFGFEQDFSGDEGKWESDNSLLAVDEDHHLVATYDSDSESNNPGLWLDGVSESAFELSSPDGTPRDDAALNMFIGNRSDRDRSFDGLLWDLRIYNSVLPESVIQSIYEARGSDNVVAGLLARWPMFGEEGAVESAIDVSIFQDTATNTGSVPHADDPNAGHW